MYADAVIIGVGSANIYDSDNPFTFEQRKALLQLIVVRENLSDRVRKIVALNDYYDDEKWFSHTIDRVGQFDVSVGNNEWVNGIFEKRGYTALRIPYYRRHLYEGVKIRKRINAEKPWIDRVPEYTVPLINKYLYDNPHMPYRFDHIGVGGTFDRFHKGHRVLLQAAFMYGRTVSVGIATDKLYRHKPLSGIIENYDTRKKKVIAFLKEKTYLGRANLFPLSDVYGATRYDGTIEAIVVSKQTYPGAIKINEMRKKNHLPKLHIIKIPNVNADDKVLLSSERIRKGEIDWEGRSYWLSVIGYFEKKQKRILPDYLRKELRKPLGKVIRGKEDELEKTAKRTIQFINELKPTMVIAVGDIIAMSLEQVGYVPDLKIIDYRSRRKEIKVTDSASLAKRIINKPGTISKQALLAIKKEIHRYLSHPTGDRKIVIDGEEDLLALPALIFAPLHSLILYGQFDKGVVMVYVDEKKKEEIKKILKKFRG